MKKLLPVISTIILSLILLFTLPSIIPTFANTISPIPIITPSPTSSNIQITSVQVISDNGETQSLNISSMNASLANTSDSFAIVGEDMTVYIAVNNSSPTSIITNVSMDCTTPSGKQTLNLTKLNAYAGDMRWVIQKYFTVDDIGVWTINKVTANDDSNNTGEKSFSNLKFLLISNHIVNNHWILIIL